ncbi:XRE family transcriptional regulator [Psychrobacter sp. LV10R520-6]|uniref:XRE family transcriptional regulator n=1 Tax=Psychrobacter sp. LV10R520-6 TaxID=1415574 RepID=UPI0024C5917B|nr:ImmA/IrrE family metallo-endopeptidase [Psychrobacter sp. LV10R520-6]SNT71024.1 Zn-dependent peptidase ImmA, M78 family [Psychrobacter sp. LV10R520-6]
MAYALINPDIVSWAIKRSGLSMSDISKKLSIKEEKLAEVEQGKANIAFGKAKQFAKITNIPFGFLFLNEVPREDNLALPDLRTIDSKELSEPSHALKEIVRLNQERVEWYRSYLSEQSVEKNAYVGSLSKASLNEMIAFLSEKLKINKPKDAKDYYRQLVKSIENLGVMVIQDSNLGHHTKPLNIEEFRGFAIADDVAPLIFINTADSLNAQLFTLIHELAHILKGESGVSDNSVSSVDPTEQFCNAVAGEFLVSKKEFVKQWTSISKTSLDVAFATLAKSFHVSRHVIARRALTLSYIDKQQYESYIYRIREDYLASKKKSDSGPSYYVVKNSKLSSQLSQAVVSQSLSGKMLYRDAGYILGIKPSNLELFAKKVGMQL